MYCIIHIPDEYDCLICCDGVTIIGMILIYCVDWWDGNEVLLIEPISALVWNLLNWFTTWGEVCVRTEHNPRIEKDKTDIY